MSDHLQPVYLWPERPLVTPDREHSKDQRIVCVDNPVLIPFWPTPAKLNGAAVAIFPGGGYCRLAISHEGYDIARWFTDRGVVAFVVKYRLHDYGYPAPLLDGLRALRIIRNNAAAWNIDPNRIGVVGFSAGGHLAASLLTRPDVSDSDNLLVDTLAHVSPRPDFAVLGYPLISMEEPDVHIKSRRALLGETPSLQALRDNSLQFQVSAGIAPVFLFHGVGDQAVPVSNSLQFFDALRKHNLRSELHLYQSDIHGVGMIQGQGSISTWPAALQVWLVQNGWVK